MKVFADYHHGDLYYSLQLLFEKRLGAELYRPIGMEWYHQGFWDVFPHINTAQQFLSLDQAICIPKDIQGNPLSAKDRLNENYRFEDGIYYVDDPKKPGKVQRSITLDKFKSMEFDIIISSMPNHIDLFNRLILESQPKAKHIFQVGNAWGFQQGVKNILASTSPFPIPAGLNACFYHQEFDLDDFRYEAPDPNQPKAIYSYIHYMKERDLFAQYATHLSDFHFRSFGAGMDEDILVTADIAKKMRSSIFTWHYKPEGDGFGHSLHNTFAVGRPALVWSHQYNGKLASPLFEDLVTCIDMTRRPIDQNLNLIRDFSQPDKHLELCENAACRFREIVNYDREEQEIRAFLGRLL